MNRRGARVPFVTCALAAVLFAGACGGSFAGDEVEFTDAAESIGLCQGVEDDFRFLIFHASSIELASYVFQQWAFGGEALNPGVGGHLVFFEIPAINIPEPGEDQTVTAEVSYRELNGKRYPDDEIVARGDVQAEVVIANVGTRPACSPDGSPNPQISFTVTTGLVLDDGREIRLDVSDQTNDFPMSATSADVSDEVDRAFDALYDSLWIVDSDLGGLAGWFVVIEQRSFGWTAYFGTHETNRCMVGGRPVEEPDGRYRIRSLAPGSCSTTDGVDFFDGAELQLDGEQLRLVSDAGTLTAYRWESVSQTGPVALPDEFDLDVFVG